MFLRDELAMTMPIEAMSDFNKMHNLSLGETVESQIAWSLKF